jgi:hypothetical protein
MGEPYLTWAEIEKTYANEWVLIAEPKVGRYQAVLGGRVVVHCADRAEFLRRINETPDEPGVSLYAVRYAGKFPEEQEEIIPAEPELARR